MGSLGNAICVEKRLRGSLMRYLQLFDILNNIVIWNILLSGFLVMIRGRKKFQIKIPRWKL